MEKLKTNIKNHRGNNHYDFQRAWNQGIDRSIEEIEKAEENYIFPRVPRRVKMSDIIIKLKLELDIDKVYYNPEEGVVGYSYGVPIFYFENNKITAVKIDYKDDDLRLYKIVGTFIEVDI